MSSNARRLEHFLRQLLRACLRRGVGWCGRWEVCVYMSVTNEQRRVLRFKGVAWGATLVSCALQAFVAGDVP